jgi:hypothetical protein
MWTTRDSGPLIRQYLRHVMNFCIIYVIGIVLGLVALACLADAWNFVIFLLVAMMIFERNNRQHKK